MFIDSQIQFRIQFITFPDGLGRRLPLAETEASPQTPADRALIDTDG